MDEGTLRLILLIVGVCIIAGIYLFDRFKKRPTRPVQAAPDFLTEAAEKMRYQPRVRSQKEDDLDLSDLGPISARSDEADDWMDTPQAAEPDPVPTMTALDAREHLMDSFASEPESIEAERAVEATVASEAAPAESAEAVKAVSRTDAEPAEAAPRQNVIIQLGVMALPGHAFHGDALLSVLTELGFEYGEMGIFHYLDPSEAGDQAQYHLVNMVEPGTFPIESMQAFETPGLSLFLQADLVASPIDVFNQMLLAAETLADRLSGQVVNPKREPITRADLESIFLTLEGDSLETSV